MGFIDNVLTKFGYQKKSSIGESLITSISQILGGSARPTSGNMGEYLDRYADQAWVFACIRAIQTNGAGVPLKVYTKSGDELTEMPGHPLQKLLDSVNPFMSGYDLREATHGFVELTGNSYWLLDNFIGGKPTEIYPLNPSRIKIKGDSKKYVTGYQYEVSPGVVTAIFAPEEILHFKNWSPIDDYYGLPPISAARDASDSLMYADRYNKTFFENSAVPGGILTSEGTIPEPTRIQIAEAWKRLHQGIKKSHKVAVLGSGLKWQNTSTTHSDMQFIELKKMTRQDILTVYGVPPIMVGVDDEAHYNNSLVQERVFWKFCLGPRLKKIESVLNEKLAKGWGENIVLAYDLSKVEALQEDQKAKAERNQILISSGVITINEARETMNMEPVEWGDTWHAPMGLFPVDEPRMSQEAPDPSDEEDTQEEGETPKAAHPGRSGDVSNITFPTPETSTVKDNYRVLQIIKSEPVEQVPEIPEAEIPPAPEVDPEVKRRDNSWGIFKVSTERLESKWHAPIRKLFSDQEAEVLKNLEDRWKSFAPQMKLDKFSNFKAAVDVILFNGILARKAWRKEGKKLITATLMEAAKEEAARYDIEMFQVVNPRVAKWIEEKAFKFANAVNETTENDIKDILTEAIKNGDSVETISKQVSELFDQAKDYRTDRIARTEVVSAYNRGAYEAYIESAAVDGLEWVTARDEKVREDHQIDGEVVPKGGKFSNGLEYPGDPQGEAEDVINCFLPGTPVSGRFVGGLKSFYAGEAVEIQTRAGNRVSVTVNHPILTDSGFVPAGSLDKGDYVIGQRFNIDGSAPGRSENYQQVQPTVEDVFGALLSDRRAHVSRIHPRPLDLHGDGKFMRGEIDRVILLNSCSDVFSRNRHAKLGDQLDPAILKFLLQISFVSPDGSLKPIIPTGENSSIDFIRRPYFPSHSRVSRRRLLPGNGRRGLSPLHEFCRAAVTRQNAVSDDNTLDHAAGAIKVIGQSFNADAVLESLNNLMFRVECDNALCFGRGARLDVRQTKKPKNHLGGDTALASQLISRHAGFVSLDKISQVRRFDYVGHVYDLQSPIGYLIAGGIASSNCRCAVNPVTRKGG